MALARRTPLHVGVTTLVVVALITATKLAVPALGARLPFLLYFAAVLYAAALGGRWVGVAATILCSLVANYLFLGRDGMLDFGSVPLVQTGVFVLECLSLVALVDLMQKARQRAERGNARLAGLQKLTSALAVARTR